MSITTMPTIYQLVDEVCARDFPVFARLSEQTYNDFVNIIYDDIMTGDSPEKITEDAIYEHVLNSIASAVSFSVETTVDLFYKENTDERV